MMNPRTIPTQFDKSALPVWAQNNDDVVELCRADLAFRADVCAATTDQWKNRLKGEAKRVMNYRLGRKS